MSNCIEFAFVTNIIGSASRGLQAKAFRLVRVDFFAPINIYICFNNLSAPAISSTWPMSAVSSAKPISPSATSVLRLSMLLCELGSPMSEVLKYTVMIHIEQRRTAGASLSKTLVSYIFSGHAGALYKLG